MGVLAGRRARKMFLEECRCHSGRVCRVAQQGSQAAVGVRCRRGVASGRLLWRGGKGVGWSESGERSGWAAGKQDGPRPNGKLFERDRGAQASRICMQPKSNPKGFQMGLERGRVMIKEPRATRGDRSGLFGGSLVVVLRTRVRT